jgi:2-phospho-L-lactate guanylyltransferase (CobY/MobA/RfbA family)
LRSRRRSILVEDRGRPSHRRSKDWSPARGIALVEALDGTTNALSLPTPEVFAPLYGRDSAARFRARARELGLEAVAAAIPNLVDDVDTIDDLQRVALRAGPRTQAALAEVSTEVSS